LAVVLVPLGAWDPTIEPPGEPTAATSGDDASATRQTPPESLRKLSGIWSRYEAGGQGERVRFYYFHGDGTGLYRYGRVGLTNTHSFDYDVEGDQLVLDFRKTGEHHRVRFTLQPGRERGEPRDWLELHDDPREPGSARYFRESDQIVRAPAEASGELGPPPAGHMWIDLRAYATGGRGFSMYQLRPAGIDGRGVGWFHRGDFDDWSTEALTYRVVGDRLELHFSLAERHEISTFTVSTDPEGRRWLELHDDPRDFWHGHRYADMGPSFGAALAPFELSASGSRVPRLDRPE
ncbi:MAG: hypothetical protein KDK70_40550, partial [Myxococcales bacterium]|nr:hypothetical protein [Myxococcales bacterium]